MRRHLLILLGLLILLAFVFGVQTFVPAPLQSDEVLARREMNTCKGSAGEAKKELCYEKNIPILMDQGLSMERTFAVVTLVQHMDHEYQSCHVLAHLITGKEVAKDPSKWKDVVARSPAGICGSGALHGAFQERFREQSFPNASMSELQSMLAGVCDPREGWIPTFLDRSSCMHGMGHLFLYVTAADVKKSIGLCEVIAKLPDFDFRQTCFEGVFMQLYEPLEPEDRNLVHTIVSAAKQTKTFCAQFTGDVHNACIKESWPAVPGSTDTPQGFEALCKQLPSPDAVHYCASGLMYPVIEILHYDVPTVEAFCRKIIDPQIRNICWARTASKFVWADWRNVSQAISICGDAPAESKESCWNELINYAEQGMQQNSAPQKALCGGMPEPWRSSCAKGTNTTL